MVRVHKWLGMMLFLIGVQIGYSQKTAQYTDEFKAFREAQDLFDKEKFGAAQQKFLAVVNAISNGQDEMRLNAEYYYAVCALELFHKDAAFLLERFAKVHPDHLKAKTVHFQLGKYKYREKHFRDAILYFEKVEVFDLSENEKIEYYFKYGYSLFNRDDFEKAKQMFHEIIELDSPYKGPANYYYGHINYTDGNYQTALKSFERIINDNMFSSIMPYYITQIYYKQKRYDKLVEYAPVYLDSVVDKRRGEFAKLIGDAYYHLAKFDKAIPFLEIFQRELRPEREDYFQLGMAYCKVGDFQKSNKQLDRAASKKDEMSQKSYYQMADNYLKLNEKDYARNAFKAASLLDFDEKLQENALFNYAKLAYELSFNPYDEAIEAFHLYIEKYPNSPKVEDAYEFLIKVYMTTKNYDDALKSLDRITKKDNRMKAAYQTVCYNRAVELYHNEAYQDALRRFTDVRKYPIDKKLNAQSLFWSGECQYQLKKFKLAIQYYSQFRNEPGSALTKEFYDADYNMAYAYFMQGNPFGGIDSTQSNVEVRKSAINLSITNFRNYILNEGKVSNEKIYDAYLRTADAYYILRQDRDAVDYYSKAIVRGEGDLSYAYYQKATSQGLIQDTAGKAKTLQELTAKYPSSVYQILSLRELANLYKGQKDYPKALNAYNNFIQKYPQSQYVPEMYVNIGGIYLKQKKLEEARQIFLRVLNEYADAKIANEAAIRGMKDIYIGENNVNGYYEWLKTIGVEVNPNEQDSVLWDPVEVAWLKGECLKLVPAAEAYLAKIETPRHEIDAQFYLAQCLYDVNKEKALSYYESIIGRPNNDHYKDAVLHAAVISYGLGRYENSAKYYGMLANISAKLEDVKIAVEGQLLSYWNLKHYDKIEPLATKMLNLTNVSESQKLDATFYLSVAFRNLGKLEAAKREFRKCNEMSKSVLGAEAKYYVAEILYEQQRYDSSKLEIMELVKQKPSYHYWIAKGILLLSDNFVALGDLFNAKHSLKSIVDNYDGKDKAVIVQTAQEKLDAIIKMEEDLSKPRTKSAVELDFETGNNKDGQLFDDKNKIEGEEPNLENDEE